MTATFFLTSVPLKSPTAVRCWLDGYKFPQICFRNLVRSLPTGVTTNHTELWPNSGVQILSKYFMQCMFSILHICTLYAHFSISECSYRRNSTHWSCQTAKRNHFRNEIQSLWLSTLLLLFWLCSCVAFYFLDAKSIHNEVKRIKTEHSSVFYAMLLESHVLGSVPQDKSRKASE